MLSGALTPAGRGNVALAAKVIAGLPAVVTTAAIEAEVVDGAHPRPEAPWRWRPTSWHALLPSLPPPPLMPTLSTGLTPAGRGAVALVAIAVAGPPAVAAAAALEAHVIDGP